MRKLYLAIASCVALVAIMGFSASAPAADIHDPMCDKWGNQVGTFGFNIATTNTIAPYQVSAVAVDTYACGSNLETNVFGQVIDGADTLYNHLDIGMPRRAQVADSDLAGGVGAHAGKAIANFVYVASGFGFFGQFLGSDLITDDRAECERERTSEIVGSTPRGQIVSCLKSEHSVGASWIWFVREQKTGKLSMTIGPTHGGRGVEAGPTRVQFNLCGYYGAVGGNTCGSEGDQWQLRNGCGRGTYRITATMEDGTETLESQDSIYWANLRATPSKRGTGNRGVRNRIGKRTCSSL